MNDKENAMNQFYTAESVTEGHPDKLCDLIADSVLDECLSHDALSRVACEVMATKGQVIVAGEITSLYEPQIPAIARAVLQKVGYDPARYAIQCLIHKQSPDIAAGVDCSLERRRNLSENRHSLQLGAGDQGVMVGYACSETPQMMPLPVVLAHRLTSALAIARKSGVVAGLRPDGKAQVTVEYDEDGKPLRLDTVVLSVQHTPEKTEDELYWELTDKVIAPALQAIPPDEDTKLLINPAGRFVLGGPEADTGLTGRKLMVDSYGVFASHGGGAFSGKDPTKVDRSGAYMARYIAKNLVAAGLCGKCQVTLAYAIGKAEPVMVEVDTFGTGTVCADDCLADAVRFVFGLTPAEIIAQLDLLTPRYTGTAAYGHFGRLEFPWERTDQAKILRAAVI
jgi:S-adenosylmethionine synthetase